MGKNNSNLAAGRLMREKMNSQWMTTVLKNKKYTLSKKSYVKSTIQKRYFHKIFAKKVLE